MKSILKRTLSVLLSILLLVSSPGSVSSNILSFMTGPTPVQASELPEDDPALAEETATDPDDAEAPGEEAAGNETPGEAEETATDPDDAEAPGEEVAGEEAPAGSDDAEAPGEEVTGDEAPAGSDGADTPETEGAGDTAPSDENENTGDVVISQTPEEPASEDDPELKTADAEEEPEAAGQDSVLVTAVLGDGEEPIGEAYTNLTVSVPEDALDLTASPIPEDVFRVVPVEGTQRIYVESFRYDYATVDSEVVASIAKADIREDTVVLLHYSNAQTKTKYVYKDSQIKVTATVNDPDAIPDNANLVVTPITSGQAYDAYLDALGGQIGGAYNSENTLLYDISFLVPKADAEGNVIEGEYVEIKPAGEAVSVSMQFKGGQLTGEGKATEAEDVQVVHLPLDEGLVAAYDSTVDALGGNAGQALAEGITAEVVAATTDLAGGGQIEFDAAEFSVYAVTLATAPNFSFDFKVKFIDESGNPAPPESLDGGHYYLVATVKRDLDMGGWTQNGVDFIGYQEIEAGNDTASMTIDSSTIQSFVAAYWGGLHNESTFGNNATPGTVVYCKLVKTDGADINGNNYTGEMNNGEKIGAYTLRMTGSPDVTLDFPNEIVFEAVLSGYKYSVETYDEDGVTPIGNADLSDQYYVVAHRASDPDKYFVQPLDLSSGSQSGVISTFNFKYYLPQSADYVPGDEVIVEIASSPDMYSNPQEYQIDAATFFPLGSYLEGKFKVEDVNSAEGDRTTIKLVKAPEYEYEVVVKSLEGDLVAGDPSGLNLKLAARSGIISTNDGFYYASPNLCLNGDRGTLSWLEGSKIVMINSDQEYLEDIIQTGARYEDGDVIEYRYRMSVSVDDQAKLVTITLTENPGALIFRQFVTGGVTREEAERALTFTIQDVSHDYYLHVSEDGEASWVNEEAELTLGDLSRLDGYSVTGDAEEGLRFELALEGVREGSYKITATNLDIAGFQLRECIDRDVTFVPAGEEGTVELSATYEKLPGSLIITKEPDDVSVPLGVHARTTVVAEGEGLTYQWYGVDLGGEEFTSCLTGDTYSVKMVAKKAGRKVWCVVTDQYGNTATTRTATLTLDVPEDYEELSVTLGPKNAAVDSGEKATVTLVATGTGKLKYQWYVKDPGAEDWTKSKLKTDTYAVVMVPAKSGRLVKCVVSDAYGHSCESDEYELTMVIPEEYKDGPRIITQPQDASVVRDDYARSTVVAEGAGLTYQWYGVDPEGEEFTSCLKGATYSIKMVPRKSGRQVWCVVTDKYGRSVTSEIATLYMTE